MLKLERFRSVCRFFVVVAALGLMPGCRTMGSVVDGHEAHDVTEQVYPVSPAEAQVIARKVLAENGAETIHEEPGRLLASWSVLPEHYGSFAGVTITPESTGCRLAVVTRRKFKFQIFTSLTESGFHREFERHLRAPRS